MWHVRAWAIFFKGEECGLRISYKPIVVDKVRDKFLKNPEMLVQIISHNPLLEMVKGKSQGKQGSFSLHEIRNPGENSQCNYL